MLPEYVHGLEVDNDISLGRPTKSLLDLQLPSTQKRREGKELAIMFIAATSS